MSKPKPMTPEQAEAIEAAHPRFVSTTGVPVLVALLSGHSVSITDEDEGTPTHPRFHRAAVMQGCMPIAHAKSIAAEDVGTPTVERGALVLQAIGDMCAAAVDNAELQDELFTGDGRPDANALSSRVGFKVTASERDNAWELYQSKE